MLVPILLSSGLAKCRSVAADSPPMAIVPPCPDDTLGAMVFRQLSDHGNRTFEGTREEIRKDILSQQDLPANERGHLLRSLDMCGDPYGLNFPGG